MLALAWPCMNIDGGASRSGDNQTIDRELEDTVVDLVDDPTEKGKRSLLLPQSTCLPQLCIM
jgi:hypothetical protein